MKHTAFILLIVCTIHVAGCSRSEPVVEKASNPTTAQEKQSNVSRLANQISELTEQAKSFEANLNFRKAAELWKQVDQLVSQKYGAESWQTANPRLSAMVAEKQISFDETQLKRSRELQQIQMEIAKASQNKNYDEAIRLTVKTIELTTELFGEASPLLAKHFMRLGGLNTKTGKVDLAIQSYHRAAERLNASFHTAHPDLETTHLELGELYLFKKSYEPAIANLKTATKLSLQIWGEDSLMYARGANQLGVAYYRTGQYSTALKIHKAAELIRTAKLGETDIQVAHSRLNVGNTALALKDYAAAETYLKKAIRGFAAADNPPATFLTSANAGLSTIYMLTNRPNLAEPILEGMLRDQLRNGGDENKITADLKYRLGIALARQGIYERAEPMIRSGLQTQQRLLGKQHESTLKSYQALALLLKQTKRVNEANQIYAELQRMATKSDSNQFMR